MRGSFSVSFPSATARVDGVTMRKSTVRPSALDTIFWATTNTSPAASLQSVLFSAARMIAARSSPAAIVGIPSSGIRTRSCGRAFNRKPLPSGEKPLRERHALDFLIEEPLHQLAMGREPDVGELGEIAQQLMELRGHQQSAAEVAGDAQIEHSR